MKHFLQNKKLIYEFCLVQYTIVILCGKFIGRLHISAVTRCNISVCSVAMRSEIAKNAKKKGRYMVRMGE
jgi:hypothetical protein